MNILVIQLILGLLLIKIPETVTTPITTLSSTSKERKIITSTNYSSTTIETRDKVVYADGNGLLNVGVFLGSIFAVLIVIVAVGVYCYRRIRGRQNDTKSKISNLKGREGERSKVDNSSPIYKPVARDVINNFS